ncbi:hypothetical protein [Alloacidobacterium sp.]|uniref:hypothetical protein n=1 Tax=Alloacidobacterium sp. TaxID=2951999 RepID=UPI002D395D77|nr:hypothetical protein [Alloacidobacterium sp.]HYK35075.1 hypothetical protein [Alloacidobacterium sp.]
MFTIFRKSTFALLLLAACFARAEEPAQAKAAFQNYIATLEARVDVQNASRDGFLWIDQHPQRLAAVHKGEIQVQQIHAPQIDGGTVEDWIGGAFLPQATLAQVLKIDQDYANYAKYYAPEIVRARVLSHDGNHYQVFYRLKKHKVVIVVLDTVHNIDFFPLGKDRYSVRSRSASVREVRNAGEADEEVLPQGEGLGFLWAMNSYWRVEERDGGVYIECEVVTLARSIPFGMGAMLRPTIESFASDSLENTLKEKRKAVPAVP